MKPIFCVIATSQRPGLLKRTLLSIASCRKPENFGGVIVVENGPKSETEKIIFEQEKKTKIFYFYRQEANKSKAFNYIIDRFNECFFYFLDDDVRLSQDAINAMSEAALRFQGRCFFGGPLGVDYEQIPPDWLKKCLPTSARGWKIETADVMQYNYPRFLGANWMVSSGDLLRIGGFCAEMGPNKISTGEETLAQWRLICDGVTGYYVPLARVWHYVPRSCCSIKWGFIRAYRTGFEYVIAKKNITKWRKNIFSTCTIILYSVIRLPVAFWQEGRSGALKCLYAVASYIGTSCAFFVRKPKL
jgi:GT2 family glycosyltransferase